MNTATLIRANLSRKMVRTVLLVVSIFIAFLVLGLLVGTNMALERIVQASPANRMIVADKVNFTRALPYAYINRVRQVEGVKDATFQNWFGGYYREPQNTYATFAVDPESWSRVYAEDCKLSAAQWAAFKADPTGISINDKFAADNGIRLGQRLPMFSNIYTNKTTGRPSWDFTVRGVHHGVSCGNFFHYRYFRDTVSFGADASGIIILLSDDPAHNDAIAQRIDTLFANSPNETSSTDERAWNRASMNQYGDITFIITLVVGASFAAILLIVGTTMVLAVRERTKEIGVLKTLGFTSGRIMRMVLGESLLLSLLGAALGLAAASGLVNVLNPVMVERFGPSTLPPVLYGAGMAIAVVFGLVTGLGPALAAFRLKIVDAFART